MILNMPANSGATNSSVSQGQTEYTNFLKRKYSEPEMGHTGIPSTSPEFESTNANCNNNWKKRHIEPEGQTNYGSQNNSYSIQPYKSVIQNNATNEQVESNENQDASQAGAFNIIANSTFMNDLFAYDANLIVPVSTNSLSDNVLTDQPIFSSSATVCANANVEHEDNGENWQSSDLLELDHRYNSSLQTEISQLHPTVSLKTGAEEEHSFSVGTSSDLNQHQQLQHETAFLLAPKTTIQQNSFNGNNKRLTSSLSAINSFTNENPEQDCDFEDKNLSWLLNFKFDEFPHLNPDVGNASSGAKSSKPPLNADYCNTNNSSATYSSSNSSVLTSLSAEKSVQNYKSGINASSIGDRSKSPKSSSKTGKKFEELVMEATAEVDGSDMIVAENVVIEESSSLRAPKKPPFTYTELIEYALEDKGELTVSGIYQWISDRFPFYKSNDDRWKNSVRHNLSINPHFRKGHKAPQGAGHLWTISSGDSAENVLAWEHKKQRLDLFFKMESINRERLQQHHQKQQQERLLQNGSGEKHRQHIGCQQHQCLYDEAAVAAAALQQEMLQQSQNNNDTSTQNQNSIQSLDGATGNVLSDLPYNDLMTDEELRKTAGQILNGIHREVEVQSVNQTIIGTYQDVLLENDYLNPIHKDVVVNESGLRHPSHSVLSTHCHNNHSPSSGPYYVTEIDPMELGIQIPNNQHHHHHNQHNHHNSEPLNSMSEESDVVLFNDEFNLNYFTYNPANDIVA